MERCHSKMKAIDTGEKLKDLNYYCNDKDLSFHLHISTSRKKKAYFVWYRRYLNKYVGDIFPRRLSVATTWDCNKKTFGNEEIYVCINKRRNINDGI